MIKFKAVGENGKIIIGFGLSRRNTERLLEGDPIRIEGKDIGIDPNLVIWIFGGETEEEMGAMFRREGLISDRTKVHVDPRLRDPGL